MGKYPGTNIFWTFDKTLYVMNHPSNAHPLWDYLKKNQTGTITNGIKWNFSKFVINKEGKPVARFSPLENPIPKIEECIKKLF